MIDGKKKDELYFIGLIVQSSYVGFYFFPVYVAPDMKEDLAPDLVKTLKGKSCFHIKKVDKTVLQDIRDALKKGIAMYKVKGWY